MTGPLASHALFPTIGSSSALAAAEGNASMLVADLREGRRAMEEALGKA